MKAMDEPTGPFQERAGLCCLSRKSCANKQSRMDGIPGHPGGADSCASGASTTILNLSLPRARAACLLAPESCPKQRQIPSPSPSLLPFPCSTINKEARAFIRNHNPRASCPPSIHQVSTQLSSSIMTLLRLIPDKSSSTFSIVNASPNVSSTKNSNSNTIHKSNDHHTPNDASLLFRLAHDLHPANVSNRHHHQTTRCASPPNHHRHLQQNHVQQNYRHQKPISKDHPPTNKNYLPPNPPVHSPFSRRRPTPPPPRLPRGTPLLPRKPKQSPPPTPHPSKHDHPPQTPHPINHNPSQTPAPTSTMPLMPTKMEAPARNPEESLAVVDPQRPGQQQRGGVVDDAEILHAYDVGVCAAIRSMAAYWAGRAGERHVSFSERRIFRREAERLRGLVEEAEGEVGRSWVDVREPVRDSGGGGGLGCEGGFVSRSKRKHRGRRGDSRVGNERSSRAGRGNGEGGRGDGFGGLEARGGGFR